MIEHIEEERTPAQLFALVFGIVYLIVGVIGFFVTGFDDFAGETYDDELIVFALNPLHNLVHLVLGAGFLLGSFKHENARLANLWLGVAFALVTVLGMAGVLKFLAIEGTEAADNFLHLASALLALYFGTAGAEGPNAEIDV